MIKNITLFLILSLYPLTSYAAPEPVQGSAEWEFAMKKAIAISLADSPLWQWARPYLRDLSENSQDWNLLLLTARIDLLVGDTNHARTVIDRALAHYPDNPRILAMAGNIAADSGNTEHAITYYKKALEIQPKNAPVSLGLARMTFAQGNYAETIAIYEELLAFTAPTSEVCVRLSAAYEKQGNLKKAEEYLLHNLELHSNRIMALLPLERFYQRHNMTDSAQKITKERMHIQQKGAAAAAARRTLSPSSR